MSIRLKFLSAIGFCILAFVAFGFVAWNTVDATKVTGARYQVIVDGKDLVADILPPPEYIVETYLVVYQLVEETDATKVKALTERIHALRRDFDERHQVWATTLPAGRLHDALLETSYRPAVKFYSVLENEVLPAIEKNNRERARAVLRDSLKPLFDTHRTAIEEVVALADASLKKEETEVSAMVGKRGTLMVVLGTIVLLGMIFSAFVVNSITMTITKRLGEAGRFARAMASGDMTQSLEQGARDEVGQLNEALNGMKSNMRQMVTDIHRSASTLASTSAGLSAVSTQTAGNVTKMSDKAAAVASAAEEASTSTQAMASGIEETSRNLESVASATEQMTSTIGEIAANSARARTISEEAATQSQTVHHEMRQLGEAAQAIGKVTETIKGISAQTSLLALNATIEAARAGAAGKGFAVVANEVKELSQQAAAATEDIKSKVASVQLSAGSAITDIERIAVVVKDVSTIVTSIAAAVEEQSTVTRDVAGNIARASTGVREANERVSETATVSHSIAQDVASVNVAVDEIRAGGEEVRTRAVELSKLAAELSESVGRFKL